MKDARVQSVIKEGLLDGLMPKRIIVKMERHGLPVPSHKALHKKIAHIRRALTMDNSNFNTKDLGDWSEAFTGSIDEDTAFIIGQNIQDSVVEDGVPKFQVTVSTKGLYGC